jgi:hypothetical protein
VINLKPPCRLRGILLLVFASAALSNWLDEVKAHGKLLVGMSATTQPFNFRTAADARLAAYDLDLVRGREPTSFSTRYIARHLGWPSSPFARRASNAASLDGS